MGKFLYLILLASLTLGCTGCEQHNEIIDDAEGGYLFAHMSTSDYGSMYYSVSTDGIHWETLNDGQKINEYRGHPDFCLGRDGKYYMIGIDGNTRKPLLWSTSNLIGWGIEKHLSESIFDVSESGYFTEKVWYNAPKMYYDRDSDQYIITWHPAEAIYDKENLTEEEEKNMWRSIRTFYVLTKDFENFTKPQRLFNFSGEHENMPTMDAIIRKIDGKYYCFIKDERWPEDIGEGGKSIRITVSDNLTGPYCNPSDSVTDTWTEAQTLAMAPDGKGWFLFVEHYPLEYYLYSAPSIDGKWEKIEIMSPDARHGSVINITGEQMLAIKRAYKNTLGE